MILGQSFKISPKAFQPFAYYDKIERSWDLTLSGGLKLPFSLVVREGREYQPETVELQPGGGGGIPARPAGKTAWRRPSGMTARCWNSSGMWKSGTGR